MYEHKSLKKVSLWIAKLSYLLGLTVSSTATMQPASSIILVIARHFQR